MRKVTGQAEAIRFYNLPYDALEETLSNAVYHKSYEIGKPIEVQLWPDKIEILSYPGPVPPVDAQILKHNKRIVARDYRNRRIGDFLKELHLTEGRGTGFPIIYNTMKNNGSPEPIFDTDDQSTYFLTVLPNRSNQVTNQVSDQVKIRSFNTLSALISFLNKPDDPLSNQVGNQVKELLNEELNINVIPILEFIGKQQQSRHGIFNHIGLSNQSANRKKYIDPLIALSLIEMTIPETPTHKHQKYQLTNTGKKLLQIIRIH